MYILRPCGIGIIASSSALKWSKYVLLSTFLVDSDRVGPSKTKSKLPYRAWTLEYTYGPLDATFGQLRRLLTTYGCGPNQLTT